jgi:hypothetical protein
MFHTKNLITFYNRNKTVHLQAHAPKIQPTSIERRDKRYRVIATTINAIQQSILNIKPKHANVCTAINHA